MKILIVNQHVANFGDDTAGFAAVEQIRKRFPGAQINISYNLKKIDSARLPVSGDDVVHHDLVLDDAAPRLLLRWLAARVLGRHEPPDNQVGDFVRLVREMDLVFVSPGGANIGIYKDWRYLFRCLACVLEGRPPYFFLNTIGPSHHPIYDRLARYVLRRSRVFVREAASEAYLQRHGIACVRGVDTALGLAMDGIGPTPDADPPYVAFVPTRLRWWHRAFRAFDEDAFFDDLCATLATFCAENGLAVRLVPHLHSRKREDDLLDGLATRLKNILPEDAVTVRPPASWIDYYRDIAGASLTTSMRYHGVVLSIRAATPFVALCYESKMQEAARYSGSADLAIDLQGWSSDQLSIALAKALHDGAAIRDRLRRRLPVLAGLASLPVDRAWLDVATGDAAYPDASVGERRASDTVRMISAASSR